MDCEIQNFIMYLEDVKQASKNTVKSYQSDLTRMSLYLKEHGVDSVSKVTSTILNSYILYLEKSSMATSTISRYIASIKAFFEYLVREHQIADDPAYQLKAPKVEKHSPSILTVEEMELMLQQPLLKTPKGYRDKAMLELLYATGMRVSELVSLKVKDVNFRYGWIVCRDGDRERIVPFGEKAEKALLDYLEKGRDFFLKQKESDQLFLNCSGMTMSRQGFWKILKGYAKFAGIEKTITPRMFRHSCAAHMAANGAKLRTIQEILGHADLTATQIYAGFQPGMKAEYSKVHPRG